MRLIDADKIHPDVRTKREALAISQGQLAYAPTVEAIPKAEYENRLKADLKAILVELQLEIEEKASAEGDWIFAEGERLCAKLIQQKIDKLKEVEE